MEIVQVTRKGRNHYLSLANKKDPLSLSEKSDRLILGLPVHMANPPTMDDFMDIVFQSDSDGRLGYRSSFRRLYEAGMIEVVED